MDYAPTFSHDTVLILMLSSTIQGQTTVHPIPVLIHYSTDARHVLR